MTKSQVSAEAEPRRRASVKCVIINSIGPRVGPVGFPSSCSSDYCYKLNWSGQGEVYIRAVIDIFLSTLFIFYTMYSYLYKNIHFDILHGTVGSALGFEREIPGSILCTSQVGIWFRSCLVGGFGRSWLPLYKQRRTGKRYNVPMWRCVATVRGYSHLSS